MTGKKQKKRNQRRKQVVHQVIFHDHLPPGRKPCNWCCGPQSGLAIAPGVFRDVDMDFSRQPSTPVCANCGGTGVEGITTDDDRGRLIAWRFARHTRESRLYVIEREIKFLDAVADPERFVLLPLDRAIQELGGFSNFHDEKSPVWVAASALDSIFRLEDIYPRVLYQNWRELLLRDCRCAEERDRLLLFAALAGEGPLPGTDEFVRLDAECNRLIRGQARYFLQDSDRLEPDVHFRSDGTLRPNFSLQQIIYFGQGLRSLLDGPALIRSQEANLAALGRSERDSLDEESLDRLREAAHAFWMNLSDTPSPSRPIRFSSCDCQQLRRSLSAARERVVALASCTAEGRETLRENVAAHRAQLEREAAEARAYLDQERTYEEIMLLLAMQDFWDRACRPARSFAAVAPLSLAQIFPRRARVDDVFVIPGDMYIIQSDDPAPEEIIARFDHPEALTTYTVASFTVIGRVRDRGLIQRREAVAKRVLLRHGIDIERKVVTDPEETLRNMQKLRAEIAAEIAKESN